MQKASENFSIKTHTFYKMAKHTLDNLFYCSKSGFYINSIYVCDKLSDCKYSEDEHPGCDYQLQRFFICISSNLSIQFKKVCDYFLDCPDGSDEFFCGNKTEI